MLDRGLLPPGAARKRIAGLTGLAVVGLIAAGWVRPALADRMALWTIVHGQCVPHAEAHDAPKPCDEVDLTGGEARGIAFLKDLHGVAQMLAIPTARVAGIEDPLILAPDAPNYFAEAWRAKKDLETHLGHPAPREDVAISINSEFARSQDQLHLHVDCLLPDVATALKTYQPTIDDQWRVMTIALRGRKYWARRVESADLEDVAPFRLLADGIEGARAEMGRWSLIAIPAVFDGKPEFLLLADHVELTGGGHAEDLQDHECALAR